MNRASVIRLQVAIARAGIASRRKAAKIIEAGRVRVNGKVISEKGARVDPERDRITFGGRSLKFEKKKYYYALNKPPGVISTVEDERGRKKVSDYVGHVRNGVVKCGKGHIGASEGPRLYPVGRLDKDTTGLIILTNDGDLTYRLTHPRFRVERLYEVHAIGRVEKEDVSRLKKGVMIEGGLARAEKIIFLKKSAAFTLLLVSLREGKKREVRRMFEAVGHSVAALKRIAYGTLKLGRLEAGKARRLTKDEIKKLKNCVKL